MRIHTIFTGLLVALGAAAIGCSGESTGTTENHLTCSVTSDCAISGGSCVDNVCHADNECSTDADCAAGDVCTPATGFEGLCTAPGTPPAPLPAWTCSVGRDCPQGEGCASDGLCHVDGECHNHWTPDGTLEGDCGGDLLCAAPTPGGLDGFCTDERNGPDPYCRSDGHGACRLACAVDLDCLHGGGCGADGLCHASNECAADTDCDAGLICYADDEFGGLCGPPRPE